VKTATNICLDAVEQSLSTKTITGVTVENLPHSILTDDPPLLPTWSLDQMGLVSVGLSIRIFIEQLILTPILGILLTNYHNKSRGNNPGGLCHQFYHNGIWSTSRRSTPDQTVDRIMTL